jgi:aspartyl-tRNA(Asn)/glutamyl-tRNA(Gln) amidotransferase subunit C
MANTPDLDVAYVAKLARLGLTQAEAELFQKQLGNVLNFAEKLRDVDVTNVEPAAHAVPIFNVFREDVPSNWLTTDEALSNAPGKAGDLFLVTKVIE